MAEPSDAAPPGSTHPVADRPDHPAWLAAPAVCVHGLAQARAAVAAADQAIGLVLLSAPGAGSFAGAGWFAALLRQAAAARPGLPMGGVLDCAEAPGAVLAALRAGLRAVVFTGPEAPALRLAAIAAAHGAVLLRAAPPALDLAGHRAGHAYDDARLKTWLRNRDRGAG